MALEYMIRYQPGEFYVVPQRSSQGIMHHLIVSKETGQPIGFCFDENAAKTICLSLDLVKAQITGDRTKATEIMRLLDKLSS